MHFNVSQLLKEPSGATREYEIDEELPLMDDAGARRFVGVVKLMRSDKGVWASAALDTEAPCTCGRCLAEYLQTVHIVIEEEAFPRLRGDTDAGLRQPAVGTERFYIGEDRILDMTDAVQQYVALSLPMKPICKVGCKGMCPICGANLNESSCGCDRVTRVSRWDELLDLVNATESAKEQNS